jgi:serine protease inhibitor
VQEEGVTPRAAFLTVCFILSAALPATGLFGQEIEATQSLVRSNTRFAIDRYQKLGTESGNILFSPYSISTVGILAYRGCAEKPRNGSQRDSTWLRTVSLSPLSWNSSPC